MDWSETDRTTIRSLALAAAAQAADALADGSSIRASQGRARMTVAILTADDFPRLTPPDEAFAFDLPAAELCDALTRVAVAAAPSDDNRAYLQGVNLKCIDDRLVFTATDGFRVHRERIPAPDGAEAIPSLIVPSKSVAAIVKAFSGRAGAVRVFGSREKIAVTGPDIAIVTKLIGGNFPPVEQIIPQPSGDAIRVDAKELAASLTRMRALKDESAKGSGGRGMRFGFGEDLLSLSVARKGTADRIEDEIAGDCSGAWENGIKPEFLQAALAQSGVKDVTLARGDSGTPSILVDTGTPDRLFLIMCRSVF